jgi:hypothetical protein
MARPPRIARALQHARLAITAQAHARHHAGAHDVAFCITSDWCNAWLDRARVWARIERALRAFARHSGATSAAAAGPNNSTAESA